MGKLHHWFSRAEPEEQGSFCDDENNHVQNLSSFETEVAARTASNDNAEVFFWDGDEEVDTRYNRMIVEKENDLVIDDEFKQAKYRPGR